MNYEVENKIRDVFFYELLLDNSMVLLFFYNILHLLV